MSTQNIRYLKKNVIVNVKCRGVRIRSESDPIGFGSQFMCSDRIGSDFV